jgi:Domain of unknown function (DUF5615)
MSGRLSPQSDNNGSMAEAAEYLQIPAGLVEAAVAYYGE